MGRSQGGIKFLCLSKFFCSKDLRKQKISVGFSHGRGHWFESSAAQYAKPLKPVLDRLGKMFLKLEDNCKQVCRSGCREKLIHHAVGFGTPLFEQVGTCLFIDNFGV